MRKARLQNKLNAPKNMTYFGHTRSRLCCPCNSRPTCKTQYCWHPFLATSSQTMVSCWCYADRMVQFVNSLGTSVSNTSSSPGNEDQLRQLVMSTQTVLYTVPPACPIHSVFIYHSRGFGIKVQSEAPALNSLKA